jgi:methionyl-tRNA formyltransferase
MRLAFMGSPTFAVATLTRLVADGHGVGLVVTQPDRPAGRGQALRPPPVKQAALRHGLPILQPETLSDPAVLDRLRSVRPEVIVVVAFGQFLPRALRELPPQGCINLHASLLPKFRGAAPIQRAIMAGEDTTGVTIMQVEERMDTGPMLLRRACPIHPGDDAASLHDRLAALGAEALAEALALLARGEAVWTPQDERLASLAPKLTDADCRLDLTRPPGTLVNQVRGLSPAPGAYLPVEGGRRLKVLRAEARPGAGAPGMVLAVEEAALVIGAGTGNGTGAGAGAFALLEVQPEGKRRMSGTEYARGQRLGAGDRCG